MKDFFKFDDKRKLFIIHFILGIFMLIASIFVIDYVIIFVLFLFVGLFYIICSIFILNTGIHFNYKKKKIIIIDFIFIKIINMKDVKYISIEEIHRKRKNVGVPKFADSIDKAIYYSKYVYRNGKVFNIIFHLQNQDILVYYGWLYKAKSIKRVEKQLEMLQKMKNKFMKYQIKNRWGI